MFLEISLISLKHSIKPIQKFLSTMVTMNNHWNTIMFSHKSNMLCPSDWPQNSTFLFIPFNSFSGKKGTTSVGKLNYYWWLNVSSRLQNCVDCRWRGTVESWQSNLKNNFLVIMSFLRKLYFITYCLQTILFLRNWHYGKPLRPLSMITSFLNTRQKYILPR